MPTQPPPTSNSAFTPMRTKRRRSLWWLVVWGLALTVYVSGVAFSLAVAALYAGWEQGKSPSCSQAYFGTPSTTKTTAP